VGIKQNYTLKRLWGDQMMETVKSVEKALDILLAFTDDKPQLSLLEICEKLDIPKSTVYRLVTTLQNKGFLEAAQYTNKYKPGFKFIKIANILTKSFSLREKALPVMVGLRDACGESINLYIKKDINRICLEQVEGLHLVRRFAAIGDILPLYCGASGKVLLAFQPEEEIEKVIKETRLKAWTENTITDSELFKQNLQKVKRQGYAATKSEREVGAASVAAPIRDHTGTVIASVTISGPDARFTREKVENYIKLVTAAADRISKSLGYLCDF